tara:strand:- start:314 stop:1042 length:729 start_codon:yes stop_codon:yes gene_type:complete
MKKELQNLSSQLRRLGFNSYASKVNNMFNQDAQSSIEERDALDRIDDVEEGRALQRYQERMEAAKDQPSEIKNNEPDMHESTYRFKNLEDDVDSSLMNSGDDEYVGDDDGDYKQFFYDEMGKDTGKAGRDILREQQQKGRDSEKLEGKELRSGLLSLVRKALPPIGEVTGDGDAYNVDIKSYIRFLGKELGQSIEMPGLISMNGAAQINVQDLSDEIMKIYSKMSEAKKVNFIRKVARLIRR